MKKLFFLSLILNSFFARADVQLVEPTRTSALLAEVDRPACDIFKLSNSDLIEYIEILKNTSAIDIEESAPAVLLQNNKYLLNLIKMKYHETGIKLFYDIELRISEKEYSHIKDVQATYLKTYLVSEISNYGSYFFAPAQVQFQSEQLVLNIQANLYDICLEGGVRFILLSECQVEPRFDFECLQNKTCEDMPVRKLNQCKEQKEYFISLKEIAADMGHRSGEMRRNNSY